MALSGESKRTCSKIVISLMARLVGSLRFGARMNFSIAASRLSSAALFCCVTGPGPEPSRLVAGVTGGPCAAAGSTVGFGPARRVWGVVVIVAEAALSSLCCWSASSSMSSGWKKHPWRAGRVSGVGSSGRLSRAA